MIQLKNISYQVAQKMIVSKISFEAKQGEITTIIGANGTGKSTLLKLLCREQNPSVGEIIFQSKNLDFYPVKELARMRAVLTQHNTISLSFSVKELVLMGRYPHFENLPSKHDLEMVRQSMEAVGIAHLSARDYDTLSGGERQRVQLARVITQIMDVPGGWLFLDEPTNGLDLLHQQQLLEQARKMADQGFGVICILHDLNLAAAYSDQVLILKNGEQLACGTPAEVISEQNILAAFGLEVQLIEHEKFKCPLVVSGGILKNTQ